MPGRCERRPVGSLAVGPVVILQQRHLPHPARSPGPRPTRSRGGQGRPADGEAVARAEHLTAHLQREPDAAEVADRVAG